MKRRKQQKQANSPVVSTSHVTFDENLLTFYLYAGSSLYAFCITPELNLEHLYWGPRLPKGYDLRFISANTRSLVFNTLEASGIHDFSSMGLSGDDFNSPDLLLPDADTSVTRVASDASTENLFRSMDSRALAKIIKDTKFSDDPDLRRRGNFAWRALGQRLVTAKEPETAEQVDQLDVSLLYQPDSASSSENPSRCSSPPMPHADAEADAEAEAEAEAEEIVHTNNMRRSHSLAQMHALDRLGRYEAGLPQFDDTLDPRRRTPSLVEASADTLMPGPTSPISRSASMLHISQQQQEQVHNENVSSISTGNRASPDSLLSQYSDLTTPTSTTSERKYWPTPGQLSMPTPTSTEVLQGATSGLTPPKSSPTAVPTTPRHRERGKGELCADKVSYCSDSGASTPPSREECYMYNDGDNGDETVCAAASLFGKDRGQMGKGAITLEYSDSGTGDFRAPSFSVTDSYNDSNSSPLTFKSFQIYRGKLPMPDGLPAVRSHNDAEASTLVVTLLDSVSGLEVDLIYTAMHEYDCVTRRAVFKNVDTRPLIRLPPGGGGPTSFAGSGAAADSNVNVLHSTGDSSSATNVFACDFDHGGGGCAQQHSAEGEGSPPDTAATHDSDKENREDVDDDDDDDDDDDRGYSSTGAQHQAQRQQQPLPRVECYKVINRAMSMTLDVKQSADPMHLVQLSGAWGRERYKVVSRLEQGMQSFGSTRGVSGHQSNPFLCVSHGAPHESRGEVYGFSLVYSGNFLCEAETDEMCRTRINMGIHPSTMQWHLGRGATFNTPEVVLVRSSKGLGGMSRTLHRVITQRLIPRTWAYSNPPVLMNSWEQSYFNVNAKTVLQMASDAHRIGVDLIVVDDGWFTNRDSDCTGLGDWVVEPSKFPEGLRPVVQQVNAMGLKFGIWLEPEMVSRDSDLFRKHPEWLLSEPGRRSQVGRNQMVLDLSRDEVRDYLFDTIAAILNDAHVEYIKWDFNRPLTDVFSMSMYGGCKTRPIFQSETAHRYVLGLYQLQARVLSAFPHVLLENCASGGGRMDLGMLYFSPQTWASDNTDSIVRLKIQSGTSLGYPFRCMGAHVTVCPNHITGNSTRARTRGFASMCGTFGFELDVNQLATEEIALFAAQVQVWKSFCHIIYCGELYRLWDPFSVPLCSWMFVTHHRDEALVFAFSVNSDHWSNLVPPLKLQGLIASGVYEVTEPMPNNVCQSSSNLRIMETPQPLYQLGHASVFFTGDILMSAGLPIKFYTLDDSLMFHLRLVSQPGR